MVRRHVAVQEMTVDAALSRDRRLVAAACALDPLSSRIDLASIDAMADELLGGTARWLPRFVRT
jgi:alpha-galactosidase/6-phospho-beta-glucosidase family protein